MKTFTPWMFNVVTLIVVGLFFAAQNAGALPAGMLAAEQTTISYQGILTDPDGHPVDGLVTMEFALYNAAEDGSIQWGPETQNVQVRDGVFHVLLGSVEPLWLSNRIGDLYLDIKVNGETMTPRELLTSVIYAVQAGTIPFAWPSSYDGRGSRTALPGFSDTLYYATKRGITVQASRNPDSGSLDAMFNLKRESNALWNNVSGSTPVVITISYPGDIYLNGVLMAFGYRNSQAIDYTVEYYEDNNDDDTYNWTPIADVRGNTSYEVYHPATSWRVQKIRLTVRTAGDSGMAGTLRIATIQAPSSISGKATGPMLDIGGDTMYGSLTMKSGTEIFWSDNGQIRSKDNNHRIVFDRSNNEMEFREYGTIRFYAGGSSGGDADMVISDSQINVQGNSVINCGALTEANLQTEQELAAGRIDRFEEGDVLCWAGDKLETCAVDNDRLVQAVADKEGRPIVIGAETIKVLGPVRYGDLLVASAVPGYAMVNNDPQAGVVIAQALADFDGEIGIIKAMIRKF